ncbi:ornithine cyclodeaminase family protein [Cryobacterium sp. TMS1-13-1]|uniref:ornithine cyclodeaminase family protein n=1 Tax=Cryobacterium sp. TMS1-13-1 TaxID=1259220 RepID=UPI001069A7FD|nr:ornithine cyclodeaminase family protein [Cryobacterium sp. TMS1-13-1]TFD19229.1 ornithine cyclodeaminase family protein [Cryobacterium sp. TMS1-13-1]
MTAGALPWISADEVFARVDFGAAVRAVQRDLLAGLDPAADFDRGILDLRNGQLLLMPTESPEFVGVKIASVAPNNPAIGRQRIQGIYVLMDAATLSPVALLDGTALTTLRTPAVSAAAADFLAPAEIENLVVFGSGPQAWGHIQALRSIRLIGKVVIVARNQERSGQLTARIEATGLAARVGTADDVRDAQLIVCATTAREPLFDGMLVPDDSCTIAVGSHEPDARELPSALVARGQIVVEDTTAALREAGDLIIPIREGLASAESLVPMRQIIVEETAVDRMRPRVFKSSGMSWEDLVVAAEVYRIER